MDIIKYIRERTLKFLGLERLSENPYGDRFTFLGNAESVRRWKLKENMTWYYGDSNELLNLYTNEMTYGNNENPIYNRNKRSYFWGISATEAKIKRVHSGIPHAIVDTLTNAVGDFSIKSEDPEIQGAIDEIVGWSDLHTVVNQQETPLTLAAGWGALKPSYDERDEQPRLEFYPADSVEFMYRNKRLIGVTFIDYYMDSEGEKYALFETRRVDDIGSRIEYSLFRMKQNDLEAVDLSALPETESLPRDGLIIPGLKKPLATPTVFFHDPLNDGYGRSVYDGKVDLFDDLDQAISQMSQTVRVSTPVEYYDVESCARDANGNPIYPSAFNRQFIAKSSLRGGDGPTEGASVQTTQPNLNFNQYEYAVQSITMQILTGILSPATMGIDLAKRDNADAQREKEKITLMTRSNIVGRQKWILKDAMEKALMLKEYKDTGAITLDRDCKITVDFSFDQFQAMPFEAKLQSLAPAMQAGFITPELYIEKLYGDEADRSVRDRELAFVKSTLEREAAMQEGEILDEDRPEED